MSAEPIEPKSSRAVILGLERELEKARRQLQRVSRNNGWFDPDGPTPLEVAEARIAELEAALRRHHEHQIRKPMQVGCGYCGLPLEPTTEEGTP